MFLVHTPLSNMAACTRLLSTSILRHDAASDGPPKFTPPTKPVIDKTQKEASLRRFLSPEFIPPRQRTNPVKFSVERKDMIQRRKVLNIPEFYVGSILAVTMTDPHVNVNLNRFVGICIQRSGKGLGATFILRNIVDGQGVEICYELYNPRMCKIEVLKVEKRLDDNLMYLRDALPEYSSFNFDMQPVHYEITGDVPVSPLKIKMKPKPWSKRWERPKFNIKGIRFDLCLTLEMTEHAQKWAEPWRPYDMLKEYDTFSLEEQIFKEVQENLRK
ncbi:39S ribosomal protein L19, mitochondrial-like isoform X3 [Sinocyclocheilus rhinocerous]|uniref:39S ribosomal protein L19, mitochondrial-like isoform X3 n=1 Tax=Sinocyclocheilus rhinocerous TaxID=307959 RepID=UPI0007B987A1|nr:PREDICTED: 39S ribosomal protein L19, mitochondrial-like isoform X3 [Sinocyclocheilus rhinocerous]